MNVLCMLHLVCLMSITCVLMVLSACEWVFDVCNERDYLLRVFDPGRQVKGVQPRLLTCGKGGELKRINHQVKGV